MDRPIVVRDDVGYRPVTPEPASREQITTLLEGTPLAGLINTWQSLPATEMDACGRRLAVEVIKEGTNVALRIVGAVRAGARGTPSAGTVRTTTPPAGVSSTPRATTPPAGVSSAPRATTPPAGGSARATTPPVGVAHARTQTPPRGASASEVPTSRVPKTPPMGVATAPVTQAPPNQARGGGSSTATIPVVNVPRDASNPTDPIPVEIELDGVLVVETWGGARIIDERVNVTSLIPLIRAARAASATDLHLAAGRPIMIRRFGELMPLAPESLQPPVSPVLRTAVAMLTPQVAQGFLLPLLGPSARTRLGSIGYVDLAVDVPGAGRVRANVSQQQEGLCGTFRLVAQQIPTLDSLGLPRDLAKVVNHHQGLVVIAGPNGHGKTTTMAALIDLLNTTRTDHIITIEDPIEIEHPARKALVSQREVNRHTLDFIAALKASLREDPDIIVIGELRDVETVEIALTAAETGHLVLATMSTPSAMKTIDRLIDMFPPDEQPQVRSGIASTLRAVIAQRLLPRASGDGLVAAVELVTGVLPLSQLIRDNKLFQLPNLMQRGRAFGMIRLDDSLLELVRAGKISEQVALASCDNRKEFVAALAPAPAAPVQQKGLFGWKGRE